MAELRKRYGFLQDEPGAEGQCRGKIQNRLFVVPRGNSDVLFEIIYMDELY
jgi:hypothetical protein